MKSEIFSTKLKFEEKYYSLIGDHDFIDDNGHPRIIDGNNNKIVAKTIKNKKQRSVVSNNIYESYYIKVNSKLQVYNPIKRLTTIVDKPKDNFIDKVCKDEWKFKEVDKIIFDKYINFLSSKEERCIKDIERDLK